MDLQKLVADIGAVMLDADTLGWLAWGGTALTLLGLSITFAQAAKASSAAKAASDAVRRLSLSVETANLAYSSAQMNVVVVAIQAGQFGVAQALFSTLKRAFRLKIHETGFPEEERSQVERIIALIDNQLLAGSAGQPHNGTKLYRAMDGLLAMVTRWESRAASKHNEVIK
ncbi:hypothetical protein VW23_000500 [Devosia insulae DS-56]|uniref:Uncharacterized protein n=1 Tax=Devosia insulae DS-56 TaxID=1116389 RepID=A0A1E5XHM8_9HYPH|nr:hypothetical protein [Devosia insulae]OEO28108.1 hypothetical protein VW23_000500 [Devosia insulae DS-56]